MRRGKKAVEMPSNVTIIVEGSGRFFSTPGLDSCWTDIDMQSTLPGEPDSFAMTATLYCVTPLGEINGGATVSIPELTFSTIVRWGQS